MIHFGTSGWRSLIADDFTFDNVRRVVQAIAEHLNGASEHRSAGASAMGAAMSPTPRRPDAPTRPVIVGYDTRFLSPEFGQTAADLLTANGLHVLFSKEPVPTPAIAYQIIQQQALGSINFTASHNPATYNGLKFNMASGAPASPEVTHEIERLANRPGPAVLPAATAASALLLEKFDPRPAYLAGLRRMIDVGALRKAKLKVGADVLYGTGRGYLDAFLKSAGCRTTVLHDWRDVQFGGQAPEPGKEQLVELVRVMRQEKLVAGFGTDGDADRFGVVDEDGTLLAPNEILPIVLQHLVKTRGWKGLVVRSVMTSHFIDAVARQYGLEVKETPVGFKYIAEAMAAGNFLMGGEESGGLTIQGHVPEKDGILACLLMAEVRAIEKKSFREILRGLRHEVGNFLSARINVHLTDDAMQTLRKHLETFTPNAIDGLPLKKIVRLDGFKFIFQDDSWFGIRLSGTEPVVRLYLEAFSAKKLKVLKDIGTKLINRS